MSGNPIHVYKLGARFFLTSPHCFLELDLFSDEIDSPWTAKMCKGVHTRVKDGQERSLYDPKSTKHLLHDGVLMTRCRCFIHVSLDSETISPSELLEHVLFFQPDAVLANQPFGEDK